MIELALGVLVLVVVWCAVRWSRPGPKPPRAAGLKQDRRR